MLWIVPVITIFMQEDVTVFLTYFSITLMWYMTTCQFCHVISHNYIFVLKEIEEFLYFLLYQKNHQLYLMCFLRHSSLVTILVSSTPNMEAKEDSGIASCNKKVQIFLT